MRPGRLIRRSLVYYWRTNLAVVLGVATAVAVLAGALLVGDSVRGSLRALVEQRLGRTDLVVVSTGFFREQLAQDVTASPTFSPTFSAAAPLIVLQGLVTEQESGRRARNVRVYGVDDRFWAFHGLSRREGQVGREDNTALVNNVLAGELGADVGKAILVRVQRPADIPLESLHGRKDDAGRTMRLEVRGVVTGVDLGEFSLDPQQGSVSTVFVALSRVQRELELDTRVNMMLVDSSDAAASAAGLAPIVKSMATLEDLGLKVRSTKEGRAIIVESDAGVLSDDQASTIERALTSAGMPTRAVFTYLVNTIRRKERPEGDAGREVPYSLVSAIGVAARPASASALAAGPPTIVLNRWAATELQAAIGDLVVMDYYVWEDPGRLATRSAEFRVVSIVPIETGDRDLAPTYPGITDSANLSDWDPPFPVDLRRIRPVDEGYWDRYRTTPKAFLSLGTGQQLWRSRYGAITSIRVAADPQSFAAARTEVLQRLRGAVDPLAMGLAVRDVRAEALTASRGATDFGEYFVYFSFFLVVSALLLAALFFRLGIEQRVREVGLLRAVGLGPRAVQRLFLVEGVSLAVVGSVVGVLGAIAYAAVLMAGLRSWWVNAVGTTALELHVTATSLVAGAVGGVLAAAVCIWWTLRSLARVTERTLLAGRLQSEELRTPTSLTFYGSRRLVLAAGALLLAGVALIAAGAGGAVDAAGAFFGAGSLLLAASLCMCAFVLRRRAQRVIHGRGWWPVSWLGMRSATYRPGRSVLSMAVIASATFILIAVSAFRRDGAVATDDPHSGTGGYELMVDTLVPIVHDPNSAEGREALNLFNLDPSVRIEPFRVLPGDDASCLNLYEPKNPRILAPRADFLSAGRFAFQASLATSAEDQANPWRLLERAEPDGAVPVIADANSMAYVLHRRLGDDLVISNGGRSIPLRFVASLHDSIFQSELLMSEANFLKLFPDQNGFQFLLVDVGKMSADAAGRNPADAAGQSPADAAGKNPAEAAQSELESALGDLGADATRPAERLAAFHRVENTYLSTFQTLGGFGLLLGTVGLAAVLVRNILERRRELGLLGAVGYGRRDFLLMAAAENTLLVVCGLAAGAVCAALAIAPAVAERGGRVPLSSGAAILVFSVLVVALLSSVAATAAATRGPLLDSLRAE
jgi:ABC-type lipoprotein release transport system permease subunit